MLAYEDGVAAMDGLCKVFGWMLKNIFKEQKNVVQLFFRILKQVVRAHDTGLRI